MHDTVMTGLQRCGAGDWVQPAFRRKAYRRFSCAMASHFGCLKGVGCPGARVQPFTEMLQEWVSPSKLSRPHSARGAQVNPRLRLPRQAMKERAYPIKDGL